MPFRLEAEGFDGRSKIQFTSSASMPYQVYQACLRTGIISNTVYYQRAVCEALARDLGIPVEELLADMPAPRGPAKHLYDPEEGTMKRYPIRRIHDAGRFLVGPANTNEEVR